MDYRKMTNLKGRQTHSDQQEHDRWNAVCGRDPAADGRFWYAVTSTGIYCRPSCGSRLPNRENVTFYSSRADAERAGYRPCRRCKPDTDGSVIDDVVIEACRLIQKSEDLPSLTELARASGLSAFHFHRLFKQKVGVTPKGYVTAVRANRLRQSLRSERRITETIYEAGYASSARFYAKSGELLGMKPTCFRNGGEGAEIRFAVGHCSLGAILVAATTSGICAIDLGDDADTLLREFQSKFRHATLIGADPSFDKLVGTVISLVDQQQVNSELPLDIRGTAFQHMVWAELKKIPSGQTISYAELAARVGRPRAVRAVASACASNKIAVLIPCHRVVRTTGDLSGYRWGIERKRKLLDRERG